MIYENKEPNYDTVEIIYDDEQKDSDEEFEEELEDEDSY